MKLTVTEYAGEPLAQSLSAQFHAPGGIVGRSTGCHLVLSDPDRRISRLQAVVSHRHDCWYLRNTSPTTVIEVNQQRLELNQECQLLGGEHLRIGPYLLRSEANNDMPFPDRPHAVEPTSLNHLLSPPSSDAASETKEPDRTNPFADLLDTVSLPPSPQVDVSPFDLRNPSAASLERPWAAPSLFGQMPEHDNSLLSTQASVFPGEPSSVVPDPLRDSSLDPLALFEQPAHPVDLLENLGPSVLANYAQTPTVTFESPREVFNQGTTMDRADIGRISLRLGQVPEPKPIKPDTSPPLTELIDAPASYPPSDAIIPGFTDLLDNPGALPLAEPLEPIPSAPVNELQVKAITRSDIGELFHRAQTGQLYTSGPGRARAATMPPASRRPLDEPTTRTRSTPAYPSGRLRLPTHSEPAQADPQDDAGKTEFSVVGSRSLVAPQLAPLQEPKTSPDDPSPEMAPARQDEMQLEGARAIASFMKAAGIEQAKPSAMPLEERMAQLGRLLKLFTDGTVRLMSSRTLIKHEVHAELTRVMESANNPFKILPSGQAVLIQMFGQHLPGFLPPEQAIDEALANLQHHQLGVLAGTRTALFELISELNPERSEVNNGPRGLLDRLLPSRMEARRWRHYHEHYQAVLAQLENEDFYRLFGETFRRAYEDEIDRCSTANTRQTEISV